MQWIKYHLIEQLFYIFLFILTVLLSCKLDRYLTAEQKNAFTKPYYKMLCVYVRMGYIKVHSLIFSISVSVVKLYFDNTNMKQMQLLKVMLHSAATLAESRNTVNCC